MRPKTYKGFGVHLKAGTWADMARIPVETLHRYMARGMSVENLLRLRGVTFDPGDAEKQPLPKLERKQRIGHRMLVIRFNVYQLLLRSGYIIEGEPREVVSVEHMRDTERRVTFRGRLLGVYDYSDKVLKLNGGEGLREEDMAQDWAEIMEGDLGWRLSTKTRKHLVQRALDRQAEKYQGEPYPEGWNTVDQ